MSILLITNQQDITTDFIVRRLRERKLPFYRLNTEEIGRSIFVNFDFSNERYFLHDRESQILIDLKTVKSVYYRRPEVNDRYSSLTEGEFNFVRSELFYTLQGLYTILDSAAWLNHAINIRNAENKIYQIILAKSMGFLVPPSLITNSPQEAKDFYNQNDNNCIIKPIKSGLVAGEIEEGVIFTSKLVFEDKDLERVSICPIYLQPLIRKLSDIRVTVVGNDVFAVRIYSQVSDEASTDWRKSSVPLEHVTFALPKDIEERCVGLVKNLGLQYGAIDFIENEKGEFVFLEINPNGQWAWIENRLNLKISDAITELLAKKLVPFQGSDMAYT